MKLGNITDFDSDRDISVISPPKPPPICNSWSTDSNEVISLVDQLTGIHSPFQLSIILHNLKNGVNTWGILKSGLSYDDVPHYSRLLYKTLFAGYFVYGKRDRHDSVLFKYGAHTKLGQIQAVFGHYNSSFRAKCRLVLIRLMYQIDPDIGNTAVVHAFGHRRFKYALSSTWFICTVLVHASTLLQLVMLVVHSYWFKQNYGTYKRFEDICDYPYSQESIRFSKVHGSSILKRTEQTGSSI